MYRTKPRLLASTVPRVVDSARTVTVPGWGRADPAPVEAVGVGSSDDVAACVAEPAQPASATVASPNAAMRAWVNGR